jgi:transcriptional regulator with XRE-family HTH domain
MGPEQIARNRTLQAELYGEPLGELFRHLADQLGLNQSRLSEVVGLSKPMLSQLMSAQRVKIGNPAVLQRIQALGELAHEVSAVDLEPPVLQQRLAEVAAGSGGWSRTTQSAPREPQGAVRTLQAVLRATASAAELLSAAERLETTHPGIAELLRVYGAGRTNEAVAHYRRIEHLL